MTIMSDAWIREQCTDPSKPPMIHPYTPELVSMVNGIKLPSYGPSSYGYDIRLGNQFLVLCQVIHGPNNEPVVIDSRTGAPNHIWDSVVGDSLIIPPGGCVLGVSLEYIRVPTDCSVVCMAKSTFARMFLEATVTPLESGWHGHITIELVNKAPLPIRIHAGDGIMQMLFFKGDRPCDVSYADRNGKYQNQPSYPIPPQYVVTS